MPSTKFEKALSFTLRWEGEYVNDPDDPGGATNKGITTKVYIAYRKSKGQPVQDVRHILDSEVRDIYKTKYWDAANCESLPEPSSTVAFDIAVNSGVGRIKQFMTELRTKLNPDPSDDHIEIATRLLEMRTAFYYRIVKNNPSQKKFLNGWLNRTRDLREYCKLRQKVGSK